MAPQLQTGSARYPSGEAGPSSRTDRSRERSRRGWRIGRSPCPRRGSPRRWQRHAGGTRRRREAWAYVLRTSGGRSSAARGALAYGPRVGGRLSIDPVQFVRADQRVGPLRSVPMADETLGPGHTHSPDVARAGGGDGIESALPWNRTWAGHDLRCRAVPVPNKGVDGSTLPVDSSASSSRPSGDRPEVSGSCSMPR